MNPYDDIINLPHHVSRNHPQMSMRDRAAQFSPFAALVGYEDAVAETGRLTEQKRELSAQELAELNQRLCFLAEHLKDQPKVSIEYFVPDERKSGGAYQVIDGSIRKINLTERVITMSSGESIRMDDIMSISKRPASYMSASKSSRVPGELEKLCGKRRPIGRQQGFGLICRS